MIKRTLTALGLVLGLATAVAAHAAAPAQNCIGTFTAGTVTSVSCGTSQAVAANGSVIGTYTFTNSTGNSFVSITDDKSNPYTILDTNGPHFGGYYVVTFVGYNLAGGPKTVTANLSGAGVTNSTQMWWSEYPGVNGTDVHTSQFIPSVTTLTGQASSGNVTTTNASDIIWGSVLTAAGVVEDTPANSGATQRISASGGNVTEDFSAPAGSVAAQFTSSVSDSQTIFVAAMKPAAVPTAVNCSPSVLMDNAALHTSICAYTVTMSDGSTYSGTTTVSPSNVFMPVSGTGNSTAETARALTSADDGTAAMTIQASQNGVSVSKTFNVQITPASVSGTPFTFGWKNIDPGAGASDGPGIVTMPHTGTIEEITVRVAVPATAPALFDIYHAAPNQACTAGSKIHVGDLDASRPADSLQVVSGSNLQNQSLAVGDTLCVVTQPGFPTTGEVSLTVTVL